MLFLIRNLLLKLKLTQILKTMEKAIRLLTSKLELQTHALYISKHFVLTLEHILHSDLYEVPTKLFLNLKSKFNSFRWNLNFANLVYINGIKERKLIFYRKTLYKNLILPHFHSI